MFRKISIGMRIGILVLTALVMIVGLCGYFYLSSRGFAVKASDTAKGLYLSEEKRRIRDAIIIMSKSIENMTANIADRQDKIRIISKMIDNAIYEDDKSGYFFVYSMDGEVLAHNNKSLVGKNLGQATDKNGVAFNARLAEEARRGGGFVEFIFAKPNKGDQPKIAYAKAISGTDFWIGTGIYIDNVAEVEKGILDSMLELSGKESLYAVAVASVMVLLIFLPLARGIFRSVVLPVREATAVAGAVFNGKLDITIDTSGQDEAAALQRALASMVATLRDNEKSIEANAAEARAKTAEATKAVEEANAARAGAEKARQEGMLAAAGHLEIVVGALSDISGQLDRSIRDSEKGASTQATRITQTAAAISQMNASIQDVAGNAEIASDTAGTAKAKAEDGVLAVEKAMQSIQSVQRQSQESQKDMEALGAQADAINQIMNVISDIADQTNLLALNAAIEAARAGEAGRGFAVVADEVRKLAEKTMASTNDVGNAIRGIQQAAKKNMDNVEATVSRIQEATELAAQSSSVLQEIMLLVDNASNQIRTIAVSGGQQSTTCEQINKSIMDVNSIADSTANGMTTASAAVRSMSAQVGELRDLIDELKGIH